MDFLKKLYQLFLNPFVLIGIIIVLILFRFQTCSSNKNNEELQKQNNEALKKQVVVEQNKNKEQQYSIAAYESENNGIKNYSKDLENEVKILKNRKPLFITKFQTVYSGDSLKIKNKLAKLGNDNYSLNWDYTNKDSSRILSGSSAFVARAIFNKQDSIFKLDIIPGITTVVNDQIRLDFVVGLTHNKKTKFDEIFVTPKNPNVTIGKLEGAILNKKKDKTYSLSIQAGYGIVWWNKNFVTAPYIGLGISKRILNLF